MRSGIAGIDHVIIAVGDLERARRGWTRLGFNLTPRGRHLGQGTANYCIMFERDYLELLGYVEADEQARRLQAFLARRRGGPMGLAFAPGAAIDEVRAQLAGNGLHPGEPRALARQLELPAGTVVPRFSLIDLPAEDTPALDCFVCGHLTPDLMRRPEWLVHPNGALGVRAVHVLVEDTAPLLPAYDRAFGLHEVTTTDAVASLQVGSHRIVFTTPDDFATMHPGIDIEDDFPLPGIVALELAIGHSDETADYLTQWQIPFDDMPDGSIAIPAAEADGTVLLFSAA
jgi:catechol 2,3-dioxygenase-like lactoylglutathione lyase family enzyme